MENSEFIPVGMIDNEEVLAFELGCRMRELPSMFLGFPLGVPLKLPIVWDVVEERF